MASAWVAPGDGNTVSELRASLHVGLIYKRQGRRRRANNHE